jgi:hypothetical protein
MAIVFVAAGVFYAPVTIALLALSDPDAGDTIKIGLGFAVSLWSIFRLRRCGLYPDHDGVLVLNPLSSTRLRWDEIRRFALTERGQGRVERVRGSAVKIFGIQQNTWATLRRASRTPETAMIDELNRRLTDRLGAAGPASAHAGAGG